VLKFKCKIPVPKAYLTHTSLRDLPLYVAAYKVHEYVELFVVTDLLINH